MVDVPLFLPKVSVQAPMHTLFVGLHLAFSFALFQWYIPSVLSTFFCTQLISIIWKSTLLESFCTEYSCSDQTFDIG